MRNYYIVKNGTNSGPYTFEQLKYHGVAPNTKVWYEGLPEWVEAQMVPELNPLFVVPMIAYTPKHEKPGVDWKLVGGLAVVAVVLMLLGWYFTRGFGGIIDPRPEPVVIDQKEARRNEIRNNWTAYVDTNIEGYDKVLLGGFRNIKVRAHNRMEFLIEKLHVEVVYTLQNGTELSDELIIENIAPQKSALGFVEGRDRGISIKSKVVGIECQTLNLFSYQSRK